MHRPTYPRKKRLVYRVDNGRPLQHPRLEDFPESKELARDITSVVNPMVPPNVCGWRLGGSVAVAARQIGLQGSRGIKFDIVKFFPSIDQQRMKGRCDRVDPTWWPRIEQWLPRKGLPTGAHFSPVLGNLLLLDIDLRFPQSVRYCDNIMVLGDDAERQFLKMKRHIEDIGFRIHEVEINPTHFCKTMIVRRVTKRRNGSSDVN